MVDSNLMKWMFLIPVLGLITLTFSFAHAESGNFDLRGSGAAITNSDNPILYTSGIRLALHDVSSLDHGALFVKGDNTTVITRFVGDHWKFSYDNDGSFHAEGPATTNNHDVYTIALDGTRVFGTASGSLWKVSGVIQKTNNKIILNYLLVGNDPLPTINIDNTAKVLIPNGNSEQANTGFFLPLNLEIMRGTTVIWQNQDDIGHTVQSQDEHGNIIPLFNSGILKTGDTFTYKFDKPGVYHYFCTIHPWRIGMVTVN